MMLDKQCSVNYSHSLAGLVAFTCSLDHVFFLRYDDVHDQDLQTTDQGSSSTLALLDDELASLDNSLRKLEAAKCISLEEIIEHFNIAARSAQNARRWVLSEMPEAAWQNREELEACFKEIQKRSEAKTSEESRNRVLALASELERGTIIHRRAVRVSRLNQLRDQAIKELRSHVRLHRTPQTLPGPASGQWIEWACGLIEPRDSVFLRIVRNGFPHVDNFVANLEPGMWKGAGPQSSDVSPERERDDCKTCLYRSQLETNAPHQTPRSSAGGPIRLKGGSEAWGDPGTPQFYPEPSVSISAADKKKRKFCIYRKSNKTVVVDATTVDHEMFAHFGEQPDGMGYYFHWDEVIASRIAKGEELDVIRAYFVKRFEGYATAATQKEKECLRNYQRLIEITDWLDRNFILKPAIASLSNLINECTPPSLGAEAHRRDRSHQEGTVQNAAS